MKLPGIPWVPAASYGTMAVDVAAAGLRFGAVELFSPSGSLLRMSSQAYRNHQMNDVSRSSQRANAVQRASFEYI
eukprot:6246283-Pyramimonas_sp.AAC.1